MAKKAPKDALQQLVEQANEDPRTMLALFLWQDRHRAPDLMRQITVRDLDGFKACTDYLEVTPEVVISRPQGRPASPGAPAVGNRRAVAPRPAEPARPYVIVQLVNKGTMDSFKPIENNEEDARTRDHADIIRRFRDKGPQLAAQMLADMRAGVYSNATIGEAAQALDALARA